MNDEQTLKRIPYGKSDFNEFIQRNLYYVDKTKYIRTIEEKGDFLFLIRPRRFGKSLFLSLLESYYDIIHKDRFDSLFKGTDIHRNPTPDRNRYMILTLDFSIVDSNIDQVHNAFVTRVRNAAIAFITKYQNYLDIDVEKVEKLLNATQSASEVMDTLLTYCSNKEFKIYTIIDEYDNFANVILSDHGQEKFQAITHGGGFLRSFFNALKAGTSRTDAPISRIFMTGVSPITMDDVTSGFNIASNISLDADINEILGFTHHDVETMIEYYRQTGKIRHLTPELMEIMSKWYNHYRFSMDAETEVFNTVHTLYFLREYLKYSKIPRILVDENALTDYGKLHHLIVIDKKEAPKINGNFSTFQQILEVGIVHSKITRSFPVKDLIEPDNFISLLYYFGLLTICGIDEENKAILRIPNESVKRLYYDFIKKAYEETGIFTFKLKEYETHMKEMAFDGNWKPLIEYLAEELDRSTGIRDLIAGEKSIQAFLNVYLGLSDLYLVHSEKEMKKGYADLLLEPFLAQYPSLNYAYLIEIKYIKPSSVKKSKTLQKQIQNLQEEAQTQLMQYSMDEKFLKAIGKTALKKLVLIFAGSRMVDHHEL
ncbi:MAG: AAA family ATPase [Candidatus Omnitrophota bacterium]